jgi:hypothetical protein
LAHIVLLSSGNKKPAGKAGGVACLFSGHRRIATLPENYVYWSTTTASKICQAALSAGPGADREPIPA